MRYSEQFMEPIEYVFNTFCKIVLRYEAINAWWDLKRKEAREISLDYLMPERLFEPSAIDNYFVGYRDEAIGKLYGRCRSSINSWRNIVLKQLRKEAVDTVLRHYTAHIKYLSMYKGHINDDTQDRLKAKLSEAILKFRFDR